MRKYSKDTYYFVIERWCVKNAQLIFPFFGIAAILSVEIVYVMLFLWIFEPVCQHTLKPL